MHLLHVKLGFFLLSFDRAVAEATGLAMVPSAGSALAAALVPIQHRLEALVRMS